MKKYELIITSDEDGKIVFEGTNRGFKAEQLLLFLELKRTDIMNQIIGDVEPAIVYKRTVIVEDK